MEKLLASSPQKKLKINRGEKVEGEVLSKSEKELVLEIGAKAEGVLPLRDLPKESQEKIKVGDKISAFVVIPENESGQISLALHQAVSGPSKVRGVNWSKFQNAQNKKSKLQGRVLEVNKGGFIVEVEGVRGFLPNSQVGFELLLSLKEGLDTLIGQNINVSVTEVNLENNRLIFSQRGQVSEEVMTKLKVYEVGKPGKAGQKVKGKIVAVLPFGLVVDLDGVEGLVFISDVSWEKIEDLASKFEKGMEIEAQVLGIDEDLGRVNLSIKHLTDDPFAKLAEKYSADDVVKGTITEVTDAGVAVGLEGGVGGFMPGSKMDPDTKYEKGTEMSFLVDSTDANKRRVNLAPFVTSTAGLIYK